MVAAVRFKSAEDMSCDILHLPDIYLNHSESMSEVYSFTCIAEKWRYTEEEWYARYGEERPYPRHVAEIIVSKHRHGPVGSVNLLFKDNLMKFVQPEKFLEAEG